MKPFRFSAIAVALLAFTSPVHAQETPATSKIVAVDLFKNGLAIVKREATLGKTGLYVLDDVPTPIHGTFWIEASGPVETVVKMRDVEVPADETAPGSIQEDLAGKKVTVHFKGDKRAPVSGTVMKLKPAKGEELAQPNRFLMLQTAKGRTYIESSEVAAVEAEGAGDTVTRKQPRLLLALGKTDKAETKVTIRYLTRGIAWAPSYKIDIANPKTLSLEQNAVVRNELADLKDAEVRLISGYPSVQFAHVRSPLAPHMTWAMFNQELNGPSGRYPDSTSNVISNQTEGGLLGLQLPGRFIPDFPGLGAIPTGEGVDLHYQPIGKRTLADGETLSLSVASGKADYERIVEWMVPDNRNEFGQRKERMDADDDSAWDALKFKNPLAFPMTTGPAMVASGGEFNGQRTSYWVNAGEEMVLRVNKALSVRTRSIEHESQGKELAAARDVIWMGGRQFRKSTVEGELAVSNHRKEGISLVLRRRFSGELVTAEGAPKASLREEGVYSVNKRNELLWTLPLKAGEERKLKYTYTVLVPY